MKAKNQDTTTLPVNQFDVPDLLVRRDDTGPGYPLQSLHDTHGGYMMIG